MWSLVRLGLVCGVLSGVIGCGGTVGPPNDALRPPGKGWMCTRDSNDGTGALCLRTAQRCDMLRQGLASEGISTSPCAPQPVAYCYTFVETGEARPACYPIVEDCNDASKASLDRDVRSVVSSCAAWE